MLFNVSTTDFQRAPQDVQTFFTIYKTAKGYTNPTANLHQCLEILRALVHNPQVYEGGIKVEVMELESLIFGYDAEEPIDAIWYETVKALQRAIYLKELNSSVDSQTVR